MMDPDVVSLLATMVIEQGPHARLRVVLVTLIGQEHPNTLATRDTNAEILEKDMELEEYNTCNQGLKNRLHTQITRCVKIHILDLFTWK